MEHLMNLLIYGSFGLYIVQTLFWQTLQKKNIKTNTDKCCLQAMRHVKELS